MVLISGKKNIIHFTDNSIGNVADEYKKCRRKHDDYIIV